MHPARFLVRFGASAALWGICVSGAAAATLSISVTDAAGKPLIDAIALLDPASAKVAVKPMADVEISQSQRTFHHWAPNNADSNIAGYR